MNILRIKFSCVVLLLVLSSLSYTFLQLSFTLCVSSSTVAEGSKDLRCSRCSCSSTNHRSAPPSPSRAHPTKPAHGRCGVAAALTFLSSYNWACRSPTATVWLQWLYPPSCQAVCRSSLATPWGSFVACLGSRRPLPHPMVHVSPWLPGDRILPARRVGIRFPQLVAERPKPPPPPWLFAPP